MDRVVLVTGANQGIGFGIVRRLCKEHPDWKVYGTARSKKNADEAFVKLQEEGFSNAKFLELDLTNEKTITEVKNYLVKEHQGLDVLVNNAGIAFKRAAIEPYQEQVVVTFATNVFGTAAVCRGLFPILRDGARIVILSSSAAMCGLQANQKFDSERYQSYIKSDPPMTEAAIFASMKEFEGAVTDGSFTEKKWPANSAYSMSKMANTLLARAYQQEFNDAVGRDIVCNAADPGYVNTSMTSNLGTSTIDEGADTPYYLATLPANTEIKGAHVRDRKLVQWE